MSIDKQFYEAIVEAQRKLNDPTLPVGFNVDVDAEQIEKELRKYWRECHVRRYVTDLLLQGLGWQTLGAEPGGRIEIEVGVQSMSRETRRWMDYLGYERECANPLLMVESKRPSVDLPFTQEHTGSSNRHPLGDIIRNYIEEKSLPSSTDLRSAQSQLGKVWIEFIDTHIDYLSSVRNSGADLPRRTVITNGNWIIVFATPTDLLNARGASVAEILVYSDFEIVKQEAEQIFGYLAYRNLCRYPIPIREREIARFIDPATIRDAAYGVHLSYAAEAGLYRAKPYVLVAPLIFLQADNGRVACVMSSNDMEMHAGQFLDYQKFCRNAASIYEKTCRILGLDIPLVSCQEFLKLRSIPLVWKAGCDSGVEKHILITGDQPYFIAPNNSHATCTAHHRLQSGNDWTLESPLPSTQPQRTMFRDGDLALCGHRDVESVRFACVTVDHSKTSYHADSHKRWCYLSEFEEYACCRSCCYISICSNQKQFSLPCGESGLVQLGTPSSPASGG